MILRNEVYTNSYFDSATLMHITNRMARELGQENVAVMMASPANKRILEDTGLLSEEAHDARPTDLIFAAKGESGAAVDRALREAREELYSSAEMPVESGERPARSRDAALQEMPDADLVLISVPGEYAAAEAAAALKAGKHVLLFSDNVPLEDEVRLKRTAVEKGLLMMGPDCGTAIVNGVPLAFANAVRRGSIGIVAASGTGLQEVSSLVHRLGAGVSQAIGTGGRDTKHEVGGLMMLSGFDALAEDPDTSVIVLLSKPPDQSVTAKILQRAERSRKPVICCFLGASAEEAEGTEITIRANTLEDAAELAARTAGASGPAIADFGPGLPEELERFAMDQRSNYSAGQKYLRGLYTGGTLGYEALVISRPALGNVYSNTPMSAAELLEDPRQPREHTVLDLGDDVFTMSRPHPMLDPTLRTPWILSQAADPEVAVLLLDVVIGYGAHSDPAAITGEAICEAKSNAEREGRHVSCIVSVCGTDADPQGLSCQEQILQESGAVVCRSNAQAARLASSLVTRDKHSEAAS